MDNNTSLLTVTPKEKYWVYPLLFVVSILFLLFHSLSTSPLNVGGEYDSNLFILMGRYFLEGKTPYVDYFDHKGPVIIFIQSLGLLIGSDARMGVFVLQTVFMSFSLLLVYRISRLFLSIPYSFTVVLLTLSYYITTFKGGNRVEEYSLLPLMLTLYFTIRYRTSERQTINKWHFLIIGFCAAYLFWLRANNLACLCACVLYLFYIQVTNKYFKQLCSSILYLILGFFVVTLPIVCYFLYINAFDEMIYATFLFNLEYAANAGNTVLVEVPAVWYMALRGSIIKIIPFAVLFIGTTFYYLKNRKEERKDYIVLSVFFFIFGYLGTQIGITASYYMTITIPFFVFGLVLFLSSVSFFMQRDKIAVCFNIGLVVLLIVFSAFKQIKHKSVNENMEAYFALSHDIVSPIPTDETDQVYAYAASSTFFVETKLSPYYKYFVGQTRLGTNVQSIFDGINRMMLTNPPKWVVVQEESDEKKAVNKPFFDILKNDYLLYKQNDEFQLYKLK